jgi:hypothetical protein
VAQHVNVNRKREAGALTDALDQPVDGVGRERAAASDEDEGAARNCRRSSRSALFGALCASTIRKMLRGASRRGLTSIDDFLPNAAD